jgi:hypothetical protein
MLCLSVGMAACVAAWILVDAAILRPFGVRDSDRLIVLWESDLTRNQPLIEMSVLSHRLWQTRFGGASSVIGQRVFLDGADHLIIGMMPAGFAFPDDPDAWVSVERVLGQAFQDMPVSQPRQVGVLEVLARRHPAASNREVQAEVASIVQNLSRQHSTSATSSTEGPLTSDQVIQTMRRRARCRDRRLSDDG